jgi:hypothetical protein
MISRFIFLILFFSSNTFTFLHLNLSFQLSDFRFKLLFIFLLNPLNVSKESNLFLSLPLQTPRLLDQLSLLLLLPLHNFVHLIKDVHQVPAAELVSTTWNRYWNVVGMIRL